MSLITIAIGQGGLSLHSAFTQYAADYIAELRYCPSEKASIEHKSKEEFASALDISYFGGKGEKEDDTLLPRSIVVATGIDVSEAFYRVQLGESAKHSMINRNGNRAKRGLNSNSRGWKYDEDHVLHLPEASHDLWCRGFTNATIHEESILEVIRKCMEETDAPGGFVSFASLGGGSGSGIGAYVARILSDQFPKLIHLPAAIAPFTYGECGMQSVNTTMALSYYQDFCDGVLLLQNDIQASLCAKVFGVGSNSFDCFNMLAATNVFHGLRPPSSTCPISGSVRFGNSLNFITDGLCSCPSMKLLNLDLLPLERLDGVKRNAVSIHQIASQLADRLKADPTLVDGLNNEKVSLIAKEPTSQDPVSGTKQRGAQGLKEQIIIKDFSNYEKTEISQSDTKNSFKHVRHIPVKSPDCEHIKITENGISLLNAPSTDAKPTTSSSFKLIKTVGKKRANVTKFNVVAGVQVNVGGNVNENVNLVDLYQDVLFWKHSTRPLQVSYCPSDVGLLGTTMSQISNSQAVVPFLDFTITTAKMCYATNAYMHRFNEDGIAMEELQHGIINVQELMESYGAMSNMP
ncbi:tubulin delta chain [Babesia ovata]|uniref:Tubulin delta chain n=1 Tax=Babesia ovata TaxID=189622 RepID=A0A2H6K9B2_9APIC|nr:tubulin delta chain [Babesia ovata]GBE59573.1 tubulin delta chain [Babesia ovata]